MAELGDVIVEANRRKAMDLLEVQATEERGFLQRTTDFLTGQSPAEERLPALGSIGEGLTTGQKIKIAGGMLSTPDEKARAEIVKRIVPGSTYEEDRFGNFVIEFGEDTPELAGQRFAVNPAGLDFEDFMTAVSEVTKFIPAARFAGMGKTAIRRITRAFFAESVTQGVSETASTLLGAEIELGAAGVRIGIAGAAGAAGQGVADVVIPFARQAIRTRRFVRNGKLTARGREVAKKAGINPEDVDRVFNDMFARELSKRQPLLRRVDEGAATVAGTTALAQRFGVPLSRGQRAQDVEQLSNEELLRQTAPTRPAVRDFDVSQRESIGEAQQGIQDTLGGVGIKTRTEAGRVGLQRFEEISEQMSSAISQAYKEAGDIGATFTGRSLTALSKAADDVAVGMPDPKLTPAATSILNEISNLDALIRNAPVKRKFLGPKGGPFRLEETQTHPIDLELFDLIRRRMLAAKRTIPKDNKADAKFSQDFINLFDEFIEDAFVNELFRGPPEALSSLLAARQARRLYTETFGARNLKDQAGKIIQKTREIDATPEQFIDTVLGAGRLGGRKLSARVVERVAEILGRDSAEFGAIKEAAFLQLHRGQTIGRQATEIKDFLRENPSLAAQLFNAQERRVLTMYAETIRRIAPQKEALNPSRTAFTLNAIQQGTSRTLRIAAQKQVFGGQALLGNVIGIFREFFNLFSKQGQRVRAAAQMTKDFALITSTIPATVAPSLGQALSENLGVTGNGKTPLRAAELPVGLTPPAPPEQSAAPRPNGNPLGLRGQPAFTPFAPAAPPLPGAEPPSRAAEPVGRPRSQTQTGP